jgi:hypothetical protein
MERIGYTNKPTAKDLYSNVQSDQNVNPFDQNPFDANPFDGELQQVMKSGEGKFSNGVEIESNVAENNSAKNANNENLQAAADLAYRLHYAIINGLWNVVKEIVTNASSKALNDARVVYNKKAAHEGVPADMFTEIYILLDQLMGFNETKGSWDEIAAKALFKLFAGSLPSNHSSEGSLMLNVNGIQGPVGAQGANFSVSLGRTRTTISSDSDLLASRILMKTPGGWVKSEPKAQTMVVSDASEGVYDFLFFVWPEGSRKLTVLRIRQDVASLQDILFDLAETFEPIEYSSHRASLELDLINLGGGVVEDQNPGTTPYIKLSNEFSDNPAMQDSGYNGYEIVSPPEGKKYYWYGYQMSYGAGISRADSSWKPDHTDAEKNKEFYGYQYTYIGEGNGISINRNYQGHLNILAEELDEQGKPTGKMAQYIQYILNQNYSEQDFGIEKTSEAYQYDMQDKVIKTDETTRTAIKGTPVPVKAGYVNSQTSNQMVLPFYIGRSKDESLGTYVLVDFLPGMHDRRLYYGDSAAACFDAFDKGNLYPKGLIMMKIMPNDLGIAEEQRAFETNGTTYWEAFASDAGWISTGAYVIGSALRAIPHPAAQIVGGALIMGSVVLGGASAGASIYNRLQGSTVDAVGVTIDLLDLVGSFIGAKAVFKKSFLLGKKDPIPFQKGSFMYYADVSTNVGMGVFLTIDGAATIYDVLTNEKLTDDEKGPLLARALISLILGRLMFANNTKSQPAPGPGPGSGVDVNSTQRGGIDSRETTTRTNTPGVDHIVVNNATKSELGRLSDIEGLSVVKTENEILWTHIDKDGTSTFHTTKINKNGYIEMNIRLPKDLKGGGLGTNMLDESLDYFGTRAQGVQADWGMDVDYPDNMSLGLKEFWDNFEFMESYKSGDELLQYAASNTRLGLLMKERGFDKIMVPWALRDEVRAIFYK